jgi:hypothetical protein
MNTLCNFFVPCLVFEIFLPKTVYSPPSWYYNCLINWVFDDVTSRVNGCLFEKIAQLYAEREILYSSICPLADYHEPKHVIGYICHIDAQAVTNLQQTCSKCCSNNLSRGWHVCTACSPSLLTSCYEVVELNGLVISCSNNLLSASVQFNNLSTSCERQPYSNWIK